MMMMMMMVIVINLLWLHVIAKNNFWQHPIAWAESGKSEGKGSPLARTFFAARDLGWRVGFGKNISTPWTWQFESHPWNQSDTEKVWFCLMQGSLSQAAILNDSVWCCQGLPEGVKQTECMNVSNLWVLLFPHHPSFQYSTQFWIPVYLIISICISLVSRW